MKKVLTFHEVAIDTTGDQVQIEQQIDPVVGLQRVRFHYLQWPQLHEQVMMAHPELAATCLLPNTALEESLFEYDLEAFVEDDGYLVLKHNRTDRDEPDRIVLSPTQIKAVFELVMRDAAARREAATVLASIGVVSDTRCADERDLFSPFAESDNGGSGNGA
ncbi:MAG TPA: hypothetical protein PLX20_01930 [Rhodocyclaceae bacterium]|uniref:hypothetical protein n=1 Tax=Accumulibacter sp. TaxID=2053492 RepID=UPI002BDDFBE8|nr:hypothetical protein [Accumulibacter sp.]HMZ82665.1 hypothetical protein [Rhodocyclaceae bacterium]HNA02896.1 hypothetical protein [Rhodocyclaceae bacterium]HNB77346.1 hypothetical protein [Rhodocyclaceae bacterium]HNC19944.1 hypothetical protein [Accumulibacter sp.]HNF91178.1 hypothetical protein [Accumulibacter sp.]